MARTRAIDYQAKEESIQRTAVKLFSLEGFERTSMAMIASASGNSKALLYHYYSSKETLLFDIVSRHLGHLIAVVDEASATSKSAELRLGAMVEALLAAYGEFEHQHRIQLAGTASLSNEHTEQINQLERELVTRFAQVIKELMPSKHVELKLKPVTMSLFGMLNWHYMWFREQGPMSREEYAALATRLIIHGAGELQ